MYNSFTYNILKKKNVLIRTIKFNRIPNVCSPCPYESLEKHNLNTFIVSEDIVPSKSSMSDS